MAFDVGAVVGRLELNISGWQKSVETVKKDQQSLAGLVMRHEKQIKSLGQTMTITGGAIVGALGAMVKKTADTGDAINDMSQRFGIGTEILSGYKLAADKSGTSLEGFAVGMRGLSRVMDDANRGGKENQEVFKLLGVRYSDNEGRLRPLNDVLLDVAERLAQMPDGAQKTAIAMQVFGRSGADLIPMLNLGKKGLQENYDITKKLGGLWTKEAASAADQFNDSIAELKASGAGLAKEIGQTLMPTIQSMIKLVTGAISGVREWAAAHPGLASGLSSVALAAGGTMTVLGPMLLLLPKLVTQFTALKAITGSTTLGITALGGAVAVATGFLVYYAQKLNEVAEATRAADKAERGYNEAQNTQLDMLGRVAAAAGLHYGEMAKLIEAYKGDTNALIASIRAGKEGEVLQKALTTGAKEHWDALRKQAAAQNDVGTGLKRTVEVLDTFIPTGQKTKYVIDALAEAFKVTTTKIETMLPPMRKVAGVMEWLGPGFAKAGDEGKAAGEKTTSAWQEVSTVISDAMRDIAKSIIEVFDIHKLLIGKAKEFDNSYYENMAKQADETYEGMRALIEGQIDALKIATDKEIDLVKAQYDAMEDAAKKAYDAMKESSNRAHDDMMKDADRAYDSMMDAARDAFDANEILISRAQQDSDRRRSRAEDAEDKKYERQYEREKRAIENSSMSEKEKDAALLALENRYEDAKDAREIAREEARVARERKREDAKIARQAQYDAVKEMRERHYEDVKQIRERHYDDVQRIREVNQENKLEAIRAAGRLAEQALRDAAALKEQQFLTDLLNLQKSHETDKDNIRAAEELARQAHADAEEARQNSLWTKVKGVFGTAIESMATIFLTKLFEPVGDLIKKLADKITGKGKKDLGGALEGAGGSVKSLGTTIKDFIGGIGKGLGEFIAGLAKGIAAAAHTLVGALPELMLIAAAALAIFAGFTIVKGIVDKIFGGGGGKNTDITFWLKPISERAQEIRDWLFINAQDKLNFYAEALVNIGQWFLAFKNEQISALLDTTDEIAGNVAIIAKAATKMADSLKTSTLAAGKGLQAMSPFAWTLSGAGGGGSIPYSPGEANIPFSPGPGVPEPGKPYIRRGWDAPGGGRWGRWGPLTAGAGGTGGFGGSAWQWIKGQDATTKRSIDAWLKDNFGKNDEAMRRARELLSKGLYDEFLALIGGLDEKIKAAPWNPPDINGPLGPIIGRPKTPMDFNGAGATKNEITININALDGADVERITKNKIAPFLERLWERSGKGSLRLIFSGGK